MFNMLLKQIRNRKSLSQADVIDSLSMIDDFKKLDKATYSRWENGHTCPSEIKQITAILHLSSIHTARTLAKTFTTKNTSEKKTVKNRFIRVGQRTFDNYYIPSSELTRKIFINSTDNMNPLIHDTFRNILDCKFVDFHKTITTKSRTSYSISEFYINNTYLIGHQIVYLTKVANLIAVLKLLNTHILNKDAQLENKEDILVIPCSYASTDTVFFQNIIDTLDFCETLNLKCKYIFIIVKNTEVKNYVEFLGGIITSFGPSTKSGVTHFSKVYSWLGMLFPAASIVRQSPVYEKKLMEQNIKINKISSN